MPIAAPPHSGNDRRGLSAALLATVGVFLARVPVLPHRRFDPDEFEHAHAAWCFFKGMVPYRDFFEHHTPAYYYLLRPFFRWFAVDTSFDSALHFLVFGRCLSVALSILSVFLLTRIGQLWQDSDQAAEPTPHGVGPLAGLLLATQPIFLQKAIEIRPDMLALPFFLGSLWLLLRGMARQAAGAGALKHFAASGFSLGVAIMSTQKMLFVLPGALVGLGLWSLLADSPDGRHLALRFDLARALGTATFLLAALIPGVLTWCAFEANHAGHAFIANNFLLNAHWKHFSTHQGVKLLTTSWPMLVFALLGALVFLRRFWRSTTRPHGGLVLLCTVVGLLLGVLVIPVAQRQYYLMPLPLACLFAAHGLMFAIERLPERRRPSATAVLAILLAVLPAIALGESFVEGNEEQLAKLRQVFQRTKPTDVVLDGWDGMGVFRPHALYYYFLHEEARAILPQEQVDAFLDALDSGRIRPRLIAMDENLAALGPRFIAIVNRHYVSNDGYFYDPRPVAP